MAESLHEMAKRWLAAHFITNELDTMFLFCEALRDGVDDDLRAWAAANPVRTYKTDYFERNPCAPRNSVGYPRPFIWEVYDIPEDRWQEADATIAWDAPLGTWGEKEKPAPVLNERTPPDNGDAACMSCMYEECDVYQEPCLKCVHGEGKTENYHASAAEMERRRKNGQ